MLGQLRLVTMATGQRCETGSQVTRAVCQVYNYNINIIYKNINMY